MGIPVCHVAFISKAAAAGSPPLCRVLQENDVISFGGCALFRELSCFSCMAAVFPAAAQPTCMFDSQHPRSLPVLPVLHAAPRPSIRAARSGPTPGSGASGSCSSSWPRMCRPARRPRLRSRLLPPRQRPPRVWCPPWDSLPARCTASARWRARLGRPQQRQRCRQGPSWLGHLLRRRRWFRRSRRQREVRALLGQARGVLCLDWRALARVCPAPSIFIFLRQHAVPDCRRHDTAGQHPPLWISRSGG